MKSSRVALIFFFAFRTLTDAREHQLPEAGAIVIATFPKAKGGSGFPARVFAIAPN